MSRNANNPELLSALLSIIKNLDPTDTEILRTLSAIRSDNRTKEQKILDAVSQFWAGAVPDLKADAVRAALAPSDPAFIPNRDSRVYYLADMKPWLDQNGLTIPGDENERKDFANLVYDTIRDKIVRPLLGIGELYSCRVPPKNAR